MRCVCIYILLHCILPFYGVTHRYAQECYVSKMILRVLINIRSNTNVIRRKYSEFHKELRSNSVSYGYFRFYWLLFGVRVLFPHFPFRFVDAQNNDAVENVAYLRGGGRRKGDCYGRVSERISDKHM